MSRARARHGAALLSSLFFAACIGLAPSGPAADKEPGPTPEVTARFTGHPLCEPSGITYHPGRDTWIAVGDEGDIAEFATDGRVRRWRHIRKADFEGITLHPKTGRLYVAEEGPAAIHEVDPDTWAILRTFPVERAYRGRPIISLRRDNLEGIAFVPSDRHPEGGTFWLTVQSRRVRPDARFPSALIEVTVPLVSGRDGDPAVIRRVVVPGLADLAGVCYDARRDRLWVVSDAENRLIALDRSGAVRSVRRLPGRDQEGIAVRGDTFLIAQDSGGFLELKAVNGR